MEYINIRRYYDDFYVLNIFNRYSYDKKIIQSKFFIYRRNYGIQYEVYKDTSNLGDEFDVCSSCLFLIGPFTRRSCSTYISCSLMNGFIIERLGNAMTLFLISYIRNNSNKLTIIDEL